MSGELVALKEFHGGQRNRAFLRELGTLFDLRHPSILECRNVFMSGPYRYLAYEFMEAGSLREQLLAGTETRVLMRLVQQVAAGVSHAHRRDVVHRDLKPENILLRRDGEGALCAKVADFGIATLGIDAGSRSSIGSPAYMAPEQFFDAYDARVDVYALGVILFEIICGSRPFHGSPAQLMLQHLKKEPRVPDWVPALTSQLIARAIAKDPDHRFASVDEMVSALEEALEEEGEQLRSRAWPIHAPDIEQVLVTRRHVFLRRGRCVELLDRRGRVEETLDSILRIEARHDHYAYERDGEIRVVSGGTSEVRCHPLPPPRRWCLSAEAHLGVVADGEALIFQGRRPERLGEGNVLDVAFRGPDAKPVLLEEREGRRLVTMAGEAPVEVPADVDRVVGLTDDPAVALVRPGQLMVLRDGGIRVARDAPNPTHELDGCFVGVDNAGQLVSVHPVSGRTARTSWGVPLRSAHASDDALVWVTDEGWVHYVPR